jgi:hypothetical protein
MMPRKRNDIGVTKEHSMSVDSVTGGCFCGAVRYRGGGPRYPPTLCHCRSCQRIAGAHAVGWLTVAAESFQFVAGHPAEFHSSPAVTRTFCSHCGTPLTYRHSERQSEIDVTLASVDQGAVFEPIDHIYMADALPWDRPNDGLAQYVGTRPLGP